jgi:uncharacterized membrane protein (TIGR02234 family)
VTAPPAGRRELTAAIAGGAVGAALMLVLAGRPWVTVTAPRTPPLPPLVHVISGSTAEPLLTALGIVGLAGVVALLATRSVGRVVVGVLLAAAGILAATRAGAALGGITSARAESLLSGAGPVVGVPAHARIAAATHQGTVVVVLIGALLLAAAGVLIVVRGSRWPAMGARYDAPVEHAVVGTAGGGRTDGPEDRPVAGPDDDPVDGDVPDRHLWDALDRGDDPTAR